MYATIILTNAQYNLTKYLTTATDDSVLKAPIPPDAVWPLKEPKEICVKFLNVDLLADWTIDNGQPMNTDTVLRYANTWSDMGGGKIPRFIEATGGKTAQIRISFNSMSLQAII